MSFTVLPEALKSECSTKLLDDFWNNFDFETGADPWFSRGGADFKKKLPTFFRSIKLIFRALPKQREDPVLVKTLKLGDILKNRPKRLWEKF